MLRSLGRPGARDGLWHRRSPNAEAAPRLEDPGVQALDQSLLHCFARVDEEQLGAVLMCRVLEVAGGEPWAITTPDTNGFRQSQGQIAADAVRAIERARRDP